jgi:hypothetical protein
VTLPGYCLALSVLLGSLALLSIVIYAMLHSKRRRQACAPRREVL